METLLTFCIFHETFQLYNEALPGLRSNEWWQSFYIPLLLKCVAYSTVNRNFLLIRTSTYYTTGNKHIRLIFHLNDFQLRTYGMFLILWYALQPPDLWPTNLPITFSISQGTLLPYIWLQALFSSTCLISLSKWRAATCLHESRSFARPRILLMVFLSNTSSFISSLLVQLERHTLAADG